jgi:hypothetical protein
MNKIFSFFLAFCYSVYDDIVQRRPKHRHDEMNIELKTVMTKNVSSKRNRKLNESLSKNTKVHTSSISDENNSINTDDDNEAKKFSSSSVVRSKLTSKFFYFSFFV